MDNENRISRRRRSWLATLGTATMTVMAGVGTQAWATDYVPAPGKSCEKGSSISYNGKKFTCVSIKDKKTGVSRYGWSRPTFENSAVGSAALANSLPIKDTWSLGPIVLDSEAMDFMPVDPEAFVLPDGRVRMIADAPDGASTLYSFTSSDGVTFTRENVASFRGNFPSVVQLPDGRFRMYFVRFDSQGSSPTAIFSAVSPDGLNWVEEPGIRVQGLESSAVILKDGRTLLAIRRPSTNPIPFPEWATNDQGGMSIHLAVSDDGLTFTELGEVVDGVTSRELEGSTYGVELARMANGKVMLYYQGSIPMIGRPVNEQTLKLGKPMRSSLRGIETARRYGFNDVGGSGADPTFVVVKGKDRVYFALRSADGNPGNKGIRQRVVTATRG